MHTRQSVAEPTQLKITSALCPSCSNPSKDPGFVIRGGVRVFCADIFHGYVCGLNLLGEARARAYFASNQQREELAVAA